MPIQKTLRDLLFELIGEFRGVKIEMRKMNGSLKTHNKRINDNKEKIDVMTGKATIIGGILAIIGAGVIALVNSLWGK